MNGSELLPLVRARASFVNGVKEKPKNAAREVRENAANSPADPQQLTILASSRYSLKFDTTVVGCGRNGG